MLKEMGLPFTVQSVTELRTLVPQRGLPALVPLLRRGAFLATVTLHYELLIRRLFTPLLRALHHAIARLHNQWWRRGRCLYVSADGHTSALCEQLPPIAPGTRRIVCVSDTHLGHEDLCVPDGDVLIHAGDALAEWAAAPLLELERFVEWLASQPHRAKVFVAGNHDRCLDPTHWATPEGRELPASLLDVRGIVYLHPGRTSACVLGLRVSGSPFSKPNVASYNSAFQSDASWVPPPPCDVLVTHGPPYGIMDSGKGCQRIRDAVEAPCLAI